MDNALAEPSFVSWTHNGKQYTQVSVPYKRTLLAVYAKADECKAFVETGTCDGGTLAAMIPLFDRLYSIELDDEVYRVAYERFKPVQEVSVIHGDSAAELPKLLGNLPRTLFWLDAHDGDYHGPLVQELEAIFASPAKGVILIDDMDYIEDTLPVSRDWADKGEIYGIARLVHKSLQ